MALSWDNATSTVPRSIPSKPTPIIHPLPSTGNMPIPSSETQQGDLGYLEHHVSREGRRLKIYRSIIDVDTGSRLDKKTIGTLTVKNGDRILMTAVSGYAESRIPGNNRCLDTAKWNNLALRKYLFLNYFYCLLLTQYCGRLYIETDRFQVSRICARHRA